MFTKLNEKFDTLPEPRRLFTLIAIALPGIILSSFHDNAILMSCGMLWLGIMTLSRVRYLARSLDG